MTGSDDVRHSILPQNSSGIFEELTKFLGPNQGSDHNLIDHPVMQKASDQTGSALHTGLNFLSYTEPLALITEGSHRFIGDSGDTATTALEALRKEFKKLQIEMRDFRRIFER